MNKMSMNELTREERQLATLMRMWAIVFGGAGVIFFLAPDCLFESMNSISRVLFGEALPPLPAPTERFWLSLSLSLMAILAFLSYMAQKDIRKNILLVVAIMVSKIASTILFIFYFFKDIRAFAYLVGSLFSDGPIFIITLVFYARAIRSLSSK